MKSILPLFFSFIPLFSVLCLAGGDALTGGQSLLNNQTLLSGRRIFELGFFTPGESGNWYLGIWYKNIPERTYVWVANRDSPLRNPSSASFKIDNSSSIVVVGDGGTVWSSNGTGTVPFDDPVIQLMDSGNLVLRSGNRILWQSFDHPVDTLLPDMKLGWDLENGIERYLNSWAEKDDPGTGKTEFKMNYSGFPELFLLNRRRVYYRSGPWTAQRFSGLPEMEPLDYLSFDFVISKKEVYYSYHVSSDAIYSRLSVTPDGTLRRYTWIPEIGQWKPFWYAPKDQCDGYKECGDFGICDSNASPVCKCMRGFRPTNPTAWKLRDGSGGCARKTDLDCPRDKFLKLGNVKLPESGTAVVDRTVGGLEECGKMCGRDCSCTAYAAANITAAGVGSGCVMWSGNGGATAGLIIGLSVCGGALLLLLTICLILKRRTLFQPAPAAAVSTCSSSEEQLPLFDFGTMAAATDNFSDHNKLGRGGFGAVYKGRIGRGEVVAVKRLSKNSGQGTEEFKNELQLIAKLQHRNLVRLLGCCVESDEKMLVYEYMENRSLDSVIFSRSKSNLLTWERRYNIICGIARGLLYLHQDSRFRIIHRDLKASNILLDGEWTPKISDFGMARIFGSDQTEACTRRVVGTYGYMSPEYAMDGHFSIKSDVFSFGVSVIEIVTGKKNSGFYHPDNELNLLVHCWKLWKEGHSLELVDAAVGNSYSPCEALRCIHVGLLCVQERAEDRPTMGTVLLMLSSETASLAQPKMPGFCVGMGNDVVEIDSSSEKRDEIFTVNQVTVTVLDGR
ncbi:Receptor-like serine/threonine-protein kinase SD1-8 [Linum perenne]